MNETDQIREQMAAIRLDMHRDIASVVRDAENMFDWRAYIVNAPWITIGAAVAVGYFIVPRRSRPAPLPERRESPRKRDDEESIIESEEVKTGLKISFWGLVGAAFSLAAPVAVRAAQNYAAVWLEEQLMPRPSSTPGQTMPPPTPEGRVAFPGAAPVTRRSWPQS